MPPSQVAALERLFVSEWESISQCTSARGSVLSRTLSSSHVTRLLNEMGECRLLESDVLHRIRQLNAVSAVKKPDGQCGFHEFLCLMAEDFSYLTLATSSSSNPNPFHCYRLEQENLLIDAFRSLDVDRDDFLSNSDLFKSFNSLGMNLNEDEIKEMIGQVEPSPNGKISRRAFLSLLLPNSVETSEG